MSNKIASLSQNANGSFTGTLNTMACTAKIALLANSKTNTDKDQPDYRIFANGRYEIGAAWMKTSQQTGKEYLSCKLAAPELGASAIYCNIIALDEVGDDDVSHIMLWSAREPQSIAA